MPIIYAVSDGTGTTADLVARAALTQFSTDVDVVVVRDVRQPDQVREVIDRFVLANTKAHPFQG